MSDLLALRNEAQSCTGCILHQTRTNVVFGTGNINKPLVCFVGEAPGAAEDKSGRPFVGPSGATLDQWISRLGLTRKVVYIMNTVMCRPPKNRNPGVEEQAACYPYFWHQYDTVSPSVVVTLGRVAATHVLDNDLALKDLRSTWHHSAFGLVRCTYHPAYIRRNPSALDAVWEDLDEVRTKIDSIMDSMRESKGADQNGPASGSAACR